MGYLSKIMTKTIFVTTIAISLFSLETFSQECNTVQNMFQSHVLMMNATEQNENNFMCHNWCKNKDGMIYCCIP